MEWTGVVRWVIVVVLDSVIWLSFGGCGVDAKVYATQMSPRVVDTQFGKLRGVLIALPGSRPDLRPVEAYFGLQYASVLGGELRFMPPTSPMEKWDGIRVALKYRPVVWRTCAGRGSGGTSVELTIHGRSKGWRTWMMWNWKYGVVQVTSLDDAYKCLGRECSAWTWNMWVWKWKNVWTECGTDDTGKPRRLLLEHVDYLKHGVWTSSTERHGRCVEIVEQ